MPPRRRAGLGSGNTTRNPPHHAATSSPGAAADPPAPAPAPAAPRHGSAGQTRAWNPPHHAATSSPGAAADPPAPAPAAPRHGSAGQTRAWNPPDPAPTSSSGAAADPPAPAPAPPRQISADQTRDNITRNPPDPAPTSSSGAATTGDSPPPGSLLPAKTVLSSMGSCKRSLPSPSSVGSSKRKSPKGSPPPTLLAPILVGSNSDEPPAATDLSNVFFGSFTSQDLPHFPSFASGNYTSLLGAAVPPKQKLVHDTSVIADAVNKLEAPVHVPSTPSPTHEQTGSRSKKHCRMRGQKSRSPSPKPGTSASTRPTSLAGNVWDESMFAESELARKYKAEFREYLNQFCGGTADQMWQDNSYRLFIDYDNLKRENKSLAYFIANNLKRFKPSLDAVAKKFIIDKFKLKPNDGRFDGYKPMEKIVEQLLILSFSWMPYSISTLSDFLAENQTRLCWLFGGHPKCKHRVAVLEPSVRRVTQKLLTYVTSAHVEGKSWDGKWELSDWEVINGSEVWLRKDPVPYADRDMCCRDLAGISAKVIPRLTHMGNGKGMYPAFCAHLGRELRTRGMESMSDTDFFGWFYTYLRFHPAVMSSKARSGLIKAFYHSAVRLNYNTFKEYQAIFEDCSDDWQKFLFKPRWTIHDVLWKVYWNGPGPATIPNSWDLLYYDTSGNLLILMRQLLEHTNRHTFWGSKQMLKSSTEAEMFAADKFKTFLPEFIKLIFQNGKMEGEFLEDWDFYTEACNSNAR